VESDKLKLKGVIPKLVSISRYTVEYVVSYWWRTHGISTIYYFIMVFLLLSLGRILLEFELSHLQKTSGTLLRIDHTYKFTKCLGVTGSYSDNKPKLTWVCL